MKQLTQLFKNKAFLLTVALLSFSGSAAIFYDVSNANARPPVVAPANPAVPVSVQTVTEQDVRVWSSFSGRMNAVDFAEIRPEVSGRIMEINFRDGDTVKAGDVLFVIDPRPFEAAAAKAEANLASARANAEFAKTELDRAGNLVKTQAIAQRLYDERATSNHVAQAAIQVAEAELKQAKIDLDHAYVKAPISGRVSRAEITQGNLVQIGAGAPVLTSIVSNQGIYADFEVDEQTYMKSIHAQALTQDKARQIPVELVVSGDEEHPYKGTIYSFDNRINTATGTIRARARFENEDGSLVPGMFVAVKLASSDAPALLVSDRAIGNDQSKKYVYIVGKDNKVMYREVSLGEQVGGQRIVLSGLEAGDRVIVDGLQHVRPDVIVQVKEAALDTHASSKLVAN